MNSYEAAKQLLRDEIRARGKAEQRIKELERMLDRKGEAVARREHRIAELESLLRDYCRFLEARYDNSDSDGAYYDTWQEAKQVLEGKDGG